jgi:hypothetical protein
MASPTFVDEHMDLMWRTVDALSCRIMAKNISYRAVIKAIAADAERQAEAAAKTAAGAATRAAAEAVANATAEACAGSAPTEHLAAVVDGQILTVSCLAPLPAEPRKIAKVSGFACS